MRTYSIWLTSIIVLTILAFQAVFQPITFSPRKDPSDTSQYLRPLGAAKDFNPQSPPKPYADLDLGKSKVNLYLYKPQHDLRLGLDLRGGMRVVLQIPDRAEFVYSFDKTLPGGIVAATRKQSLLTETLAADTSLGALAKDPSQVQITVNENGIKVVTRPETKDQAQYQLGLINTAVTDVFADVKYTAPKKDKVFQPVDEKVQESVRSIMEKRVNPEGTKEVVSYSKGVNQVVLEIPGEKDPDHVRELLRTTAQMEFRLLVDKSVQVSTDAERKTVITRGVEQISDEDALKGTYLVISGSALRPNSDVTFDQEKQPAVSFSVDSQADRKRFHAVTAGNVGTQLAIVLDGKIITAPVIRDAIAGDGIISGGFETMDQARELSVLLNAGALPVPVEIVENRTISATLGQDSVALSLKAGLIGLALVLLFMFAYYRLPGLMANLALVVYIFLSLGVMWMFPDFTLTLPGIAGIIISIGMAVDANVIIFERLKEELHTKKPLDKAVDVAFSRAWTAILDSNVASIITGAVLYMLGTGAVRGFAVTLLIGVLVSMFTAVTVTRLFMKLMIRSKAGHNLAWYGV